MVVAVGLFVLGGSAHAQSEATKKALEGVRESVNTLVEAKDEGNINEIAFRIETYKKVLDFSIEEAKDLKLKLLAYDNEVATATPWKDASIETLNSLISFYETEEEYVLETEEISLEDIQARAEKLKEMREDTYLPLEEEIRGFLAVEQGKKAIAMAERRLKKVGRDVEKLEDAGFDTKKLEELLSKAGGLIDESGELNKESEELLFEMYILPIHFTVTSTDTATSTGDLLEKEGSEVKEEENATSTEPKTATSSLSEKIEDSSESEPVSSIKDLARESLMKIRGAYQVFIEMSNLVRKLLS